MGAGAAEVTITVLNYNGRELLPFVLGSIFGQTASGFHVHVIDDASSDDSVQYLRDHWPTVRVLPSEHNLGISASMARAVRSAETEYVAVLNNDLELDEQWPEHMLCAMMRHSQAAAGAGKRPT